MRFQDVTDDVGRQVLQNPLDLTIISHKRQLAVADDSNGIIIFDLDNKCEFVHQIKELQDVGSLFYCDEAKKLYATVSVPPNGAKQLLEIDVDSWKTLRKLEMPKEPVMRTGFIYWVTACKKYIYVATGDNKKAALWRTDVEDMKEWTTVLETEGDLEHPHISSNGSIIITSWTEENDWCVKQYDISDLSNPVERMLVESQPGVEQPWSFCSVDDDNMVIYDYVTGVLALFKRFEKKGGEEIYTLMETPAKVPFGQWISMVCFEDKLFVSCSDERAIRIYH